MTPVLFRPAAAADVEHAYLWYEEQRPGLGDEFLVEVAAGVDRISESPLTFSVVHRETRRALLQRFPYGLFYRVRDSEILVVACMHGSRDPLPWDERE